MTDEIDTDDWVQMIAATRYIAETERPGFTVADAVEEALRQWTDAFLEPVAPVNAEQHEVLWDDPDPLRTTIERLLAAVPAAGAYDGHALTDVLVAAIGLWVQAVTEEHNEGHMFAWHDPAAAFPAPSGTPAALDSAPVGMGTRACG